MNNLTERIRVFSDKNKANGISSTGGYLIPYEKFSHDRFGYPRYSVHYTDLGLRQYDSIIGRVTGLKKIPRKDKRRRALHAHIIQSGGRLGTNYTNR